MIDWEYPAIAGHIPVQLVIVFKETQLATGLIAQLVLVNTVADHPVCTAYVDAHPIASLLSMEGFWIPVSSYIEYIQVNLVMIAMPVFVTGWKVSVDTTTDVLALGANPDGLGHHQFAIGVDQDIGLIIQYPFISKHHPGVQRPQAYKQRASAFVKALPKD